MSQEDVVVFLRAQIGEFSSKLHTAGGEIQSFGEKANGHFNQLASVGKAALLGIGGAAIAGGIAAVKLGADFQTSMTQLVTGAGEAEKNLKLVTDGVLAMAGPVGKSPKELAAGLYLIESAGFHGAAGLKVLQAAAQGATVGNAQMATVANAVTSALNAYHLPATAAVSVTNALVATVGAGKMHMEDLAGAIGSVLAPAATAGIKLSEVGAAIATMTSQGTDAAKAAMYLRQTILNLENPTAKARTEMKSLGLDSIDVSSHLGQRGLAGTFELLVNAIKSHMGPAGTVFIEHLKTLAKHTTDYQKVLANLPPTQQTYVAALANMVGGTKSMVAALELTGGNFGTFQQNIKTVSDRMHAGGKEVDGFKLAQKDLNFQIDSLKATVEALGTKLGLWLIPKLEQAAKITVSVIGWFEKHKTIAESLGIAIGGVLVVAIGAYIVSMVAAAAATIAATWPILAIIAAIGLIAAGLVYAWTHWETFRTVVLDVVNAVKEGVSAFVGFVQDLWSRFGSTIVALATNYWNTIKGVIEGALNEVRGIIQVITSLIHGDWSGVWDGIQQIVAGVWQQITAVVGGAIGQLTTLLSAAWSTISGQATSAWQAIVSFFVGIPGRILDALKSVGTKIADVFKDALKVLTTRLPGFAVQMLQWWIALPIIIVANMAVFTAKLLKWAADAFVYLVAALPGYAIETLQWYAQFVVSILQNIASFELSLLRWAGHAFVSLVSALPGYSFGTMVFFVQLPGKIVASMVGFGLRLAAWAGSAFSTLVGALPGFAFGLFFFFRDLSPKMVGWLGDLGSILYDAGKKIIGGLLNGLTSAIGGVKDFLGGVASKIISWKGPPTYDETILVDNGRRIMHGLRSGLAAGMVDVRSQLVGFTADLAQIAQRAAATRVAAPQFAGLAGVSGVSAGIGNVRTQLAGFTGELSRSPTPALPAFARGGGVPSLDLGGMNVKVEINGTNLDAADIEEAVARGLRKGGDHIMVGLDRWQRNGNGRATAVLDRDFS